MNSPPTRYAKSGDVHIAYQVIGDGPLDLLIVPGAWSHIDVIWEEPSAARFLRRLASFSRLILMDKRGSGLSDRVADIPTLEQRMDDVRAVMDATGSRRSALLGISEGGAMSILFAGTYPERTTALVLYGTGPRWLCTQGYPWGLTREQLDSLVEATDKNWGQATFAHLFAPGAASDEAFLEWFRRFERMAASPASAASVLRMAAEIDVRHLLPSIRVSTLVIHRTGDLVMPVEGARYMAERIPAGRFVELPGNDHFAFVGDQNAIIDEIEEFLTGTKHVVEIDRPLTTVLFTDIVRSTERAVALGDDRWRDLLEAHHAIVRKNLVRFRGQEVDTLGDGFLATFDGPARGVRCALTIRDDLRRLGVEIRAGLHTGECELIGGKVGGLAVHIGARVAAAAEPGEVIVSNTVKDLVAGSGIRFTDRGAHPLKGLPDEWHLFAAG